MVPSLNVKCQPSTTQFPRNDHGGWPVWGNSMAGDFDVGLTASTLNQRIVTVDQMRVFATVGFPVVYFNSGHTLVTVRDRQSAADAELINIAGPCRSSPSQASLRQPHQDHRQMMIGVGSQIRLHIDHRLQRGRIKADTANLQLLDIADDVHFTA